MSRETPDVKCNYFFFSPHSVHVLQTRTDTWTKSLKKASRSYANNEWFCFIAVACSDTQFIKQNEVERRPGVEIRCDLRKEEVRSHSYQVPAIFQRQKKKWQNPACDSGFATQISNAPRLPPLLALISHAMVAIHVQWHWTWSSARSEPLLVRFQIMRGNPLHIHMFPLQITHGCLVGVDSHRVGWLAGMLPLAHYTINECSRLTSE